MDTIAGRVIGVRPEQRIVLYAKSGGRWWIQPFARDPLFTKIQRDSKWKNVTHLGEEYAALLVDPTYSPPQTTESLPAKGGAVAAVVAVKGQAADSSSPKMLHFSGYDWRVRDLLSYRSGSMNSFDPANAWTDKNGALHLRITKKQDGWSCAEVQLTRGLGYGTYLFVVRDISHLEPSTVLTLFTWDGMVGTEENRQELDVEMSRWGVPSNENSQYVVQPYYIPTNIVRFHAPAGVLTHAFQWEPGQVTFTTFAGAQLTGRAHPLKQHVFTAHVPAAGGEVARINLYIFGMGESAPATRKRDCC